MAIAKKHKIPFVITEHFSGFARGLFSPTDLVIACNVFSCADALITVSANLLRTLETSCSFSFSNARVIPNILSDGFALSAPQSDPSTKAFTFLNVASLVPIKCQDLLLRAFAMAFTEDTGVTLRIGGVGSELEPLKALALDLGIADQVVLLGKLDRGQVLQEMANCHSFVLSSEIETFGVVVIEALSQGKPVVSTKCGGPENILHEGNGIFVEKNNVVALADGLKRMKLEYPRFDSELIRGDCLNRFSVDAVLEQLMTIYSDVILRRSK